MEIYISLKICVICGEKNVYEGMRTCEKNY